MAGELHKDVATLLERSINIQEDVAEIKKLVQIQNGRVRTLEDQMSLLLVYKRLLIGLASAIGALMTYLGANNLLSAVRTFLKGPVNGG